MLRKTLIALAATTALALGGSAADARGMGSSMGGHSMGSVGGHSMGSIGGRGPAFGAATMGSPRTMGSVGRVAPTMQPRPGIRTAGPVGTWNKGANWNNWHHHHHHHHRNFVGVGVGFAGPWWGDYGYDPCWAWNGWDWVYVCGYYPYGGY
jgi:hypothetical protein